MPLNPKDLYTNENGVIELIEKKDNIWAVKWTKWPNVVYENDLPSELSEEGILGEFQKVIEMTIDPKLGCIRVVC